MKSILKKNTHVLIIGAMLLFLNINIIDFYETILEDDKKLEYDSDLNVKSSGHWVFNGTTFVISNWASAASTYDWISGSGSIADPYLIENVIMMDYDYQANIWITGTSDFFVIRNCTFIGRGTGLDISSSDNGVIKNCTFSKTSNGISTQGYSQSIKIIDNYFYDNLQGISISQGLNFNISHNSFINNGRGLFMINDPSNFQIYNNTIEDSKYGIMLIWMHGTNNKIYNNTMEGCGLIFNAESANYAESQIIDSSNLVNGKPLYFYYNKLNLNPTNFTNAGQVILIKCNDSIISDLNISNCLIGFSMEQCENNTISNSNFSYSNAIFLNSKNITLNYNNFTNFKSYGVSLSSGKQYILTNNKMFNCGISIDGNLKDMYSYSIDTSNLVNHKPLYYIVNESGFDSSAFSDAGQLILVGCDDLSVRDFNLSNCYKGISAYTCHDIIFSNITSLNNYDGIYLDNCSYNKILDCNVSNCYGYGIRLYDGRDNIIKGSTITKCDYSAIYISGEENQVIENTLIQNIRYGLQVNGQNINITDNDIINNGEDGLNLNGDYILIVNNNISNNNNSGIYGPSSSYNTISHNIIANNKDYGIFFDSSNFNTVSKNKIIENERSGIYMYMWCDNNDVIANEIKSNDDFGILLRDETNFNSIYSNNFTNNGLNAEDDGVLNSWDNGTIGNYWDDYNGNDTDDDGIGDSPYINIGGDAGTQDFLPIWWDPPSFSIISPAPYQMIGCDAPDFIIEIDAGVPDFMWYTLGSSLEKHFFNTNNTIDQESWDAISGDFVTITFYINDSAGKIEFNEVTVSLDLVNPIVIINSPLQNAQFGEEAPSFDITAIDDYLDEIWYTLTDGAINHSCGVTGQINQTLWDILPEGNYTLRFYASDTSGNIGHSEVFIIKTVKAAIPGFSIISVYLSILISLISIIWIYIKNKKIKFG